MADANTLQADTSGVNPANGAPEPWRRVLARHERKIGDIVNDPTRGPWMSNHVGVAYPGTYDAFEQQVASAEQLAWRHTFSNGKVYDPGDILIGLGEFLIKQGAL